MENLNNLHVSVRERIFAQLKSKSIQQKDFAKAIGVKAVTITDWKNGKSTSFMKRLVPIAEYLGVTTSELLGEEEKPTPTYGDGLSEEMLEVIRRYKAAPPALRAAALAVLRAAEEQSKAQGDSTTGQ